MKATFIYSSVATYGMVVNVMYAKQRFTAVSPLNEKDEFYELIRDGRPTKPTTKDTLKRKIDICNEIFQSPFFHSLQNVDFINPNDRNFIAELKKIHPNIFKRLYEYRNSSKTPRFANSYKTCNITITRIVFQESVFSCLARERKSKEIIEYFISQEYELQVEHYDEKLGRFIFVDARNEKLKIIALAEEPAETRKAFKTSTGGPDISKSETQEVVYGCGVLNELCSFQMVRLCTLALSADRYAKDFIFIPDDHNPLCWAENEEISIECDNYYRDEWSIVCNALKVDTNDTVKFYLSRNMRDYICTVDGEMDSFLKGVASRIGLNVGSEGKVHKTRS